jgi:glyoxylase-like metal-dependent hydrolase (beta-lactamase superfamily II)
MGILERIEWQGIEGLRVGRYGHRVNTTCILWRLGSTLIDTGPANQWPFVRTFVCAQPVDQIIATHHHEDHAGNLSRFPQLGISTLLAPQESLDLLANGFPLQTYRRVVWGRPGRIRVEPFEDRIEMADATTLEPILLPGHSPDMTCLLDRQRGVLFGADLYVGGRLRYLRQDENLNGIINGLERILGYDFDTLLCSHRGVIQPAKEKLRGKLEYLQELRVKARSLRQKGVSLEAIVHRLLGREDFVSRVSFGHFSKRNLIVACLREDGSVHSA